jgi:hypothetical protein
MRSKHKIVAVLLHYPVTSRGGDPITTSVTNLDIHDISRTCRTYEVDHYYMVTPLVEQKELVGRILSYWKLASTKEWHPDRGEALARIEVLPYFEQVKEDLKRRYPEMTLEVAMPDARPLPNQLSYRQIRDKWELDAVSGVKVIIFGTGGGVDPIFYPEVHTYLGPIYGPLGKEGYNHLSVRAAAAIVLDRLFGLSD